MRSILRSVLSTVLCLLAITAGAQNGIIHFVFTSDLHYGLTRSHFRGKDNVPSAAVNKAMIATINSLPQHMIPNDNGVGAGTTIQYLDALLITGDIANRAEKDIQNASASWRQFEETWFHQLTTKGSNRKPTPVLLGPGNHDVSNAIGHFHEPARDATPMAAMYDSMMHPARLKNAANYNYDREKIHFSRDIAGIRLQFVNLWPDSVEQVWMASDLRSLHPGTPVLVFTHAMPEVEARFFTNPHGNHSINETDKFENLLPETLQDANTGHAIHEQRGFAAFLQQHPQIKAYFHGHANFTEFYTWNGPDSTIALPCIRVDSPMKGRFSAKDETLLSFELISIDSDKKLMTIREIKWNTTPDKPETLTWGNSTTISLR